MPLRQITVQDRLLQTIQTNAAQAVTNIESQPFVGGNLLQSIALVAGQDNLVSHKLGHAVTSWSLAHQDTNTGVWSPNTAALAGKSSTDTQINLWCGANCTINLWVS